MTTDADLIPVTTRKPPQPEPQVKEGPSRFGRLKLLILTIGLIGLLAWEIGARVTQHLTAAGDEDWRLAAETLKRERKNKDEPVLIAPAWAEPLARQHLGEQVPLELWLLSDVDRYSRVWQASIRGEQHPWLKGLKPSQSWRSGRVTVSLFEKPADKVLFDFTQQLRQAQVERVGQKLESCPWRGDRFRCDPRQGWNYVAPHLAEVNHRPYRCIYAHPVEHSVMRLTFRDVPLGSRIVGYSGIDDFENRKRSQAPVRLAVYTDDALATTVVHPGDGAWRRFEAKVPGQPGRRGSVRFEITADHAFARPFCFTAETRR